MRRNQITLALVLTSCLGLSAWAGETAQFLKIGVGARPIGMGNAFTAVANDINAVYWNPAGLARLCKKELGATHTELFAETRYDFVGFARPTKFGNLGIGVNYLTHARIEGRDKNRQATEGFSASDLAFNLAYGNSINNSLMLGLNVKIIESRIAEANANTFALDFGGLYDFSNTSYNLPLTLGFAIQNLGPGMKFLDEASPLPVTFAVGLGYNLPIELVLALDVKHRPYGHTSEISFGTEYAVLPALALRMGYLASSTPLGLHTESAGSVANLGGLGAGFGLTLLGYQLDYAFTPYGELGNVQRVSLSAKF